MTGDIRKLDDQALVGGQITPGQVRELAAQGVTMLVNNRPDGEEPDQPRASEIEAAAADAGIAYRYVPIMRGIGPSDVDAMQEALDQCGEGRMLAFCRSGTRSALAVALARRGQGASRDEIERCLGDAGFDCGPISHLL